MCVKYGLVSPKKCGQLSLLIFVFCLTCIESRVAYCKKTVDFGRVIGDDSVIIAVPLSSSAFHSDLS